MHYDNLVSYKNVVFQCALYHPLKSVQWVWITLYIYINTDWWIKGKNTIEGYIMAKRTINAGSTKKDFVYAEFYFYTRWSHEYGDKIFQYLPRFYSCLKWNLNEKKRIYALEILDMPHHRWPHYWISLWIVTKNSCRQRIIIQKCPRCFPVLDSISKKSDV